MFEPRSGRGGFVAVWTVLLVASAAPGAFETFPIAREPGNQQFPAIDDCTVAWQTDRNGDWDIGLADISHPGGIEPVTLADQLSDSQHPAVSGDVVVWQNQFFLYEDRDIVGLELSTETFFDVIADYQDDSLPAISGDLVVAQSRTTEYAGWDIVGIDISDRDRPQPFWIERSSEDQWRPDVDGRIVVYEDVFEGTSYVSGWDLSDWNDVSWFPVRPVAGPCRSPAIAGKWVVWQDVDEGTDVTGGDNIYDPRLPVFIGSEDAAGASNPDVCNNVVVWQDRRNGNWDIYGYNLTTKAEFPIIVQGDDQTHPAITFSPWLGGYVVVWQDHRDGNWDIYGAILKSAEVAGCASPLIGDVNSDSITDVNDIDEVDARLGQQNGIPPDSD